MKKYCSRRTIFLLIVLALSICLRTIHLLQYARIPSFTSIVMADVSEYWNDAQAILQGGAPFSGIHAPLYPYFLAILIRISSGSIFPVRLIQSLLTLFAGLLLHDMLGKRFRHLYAPMRYVPDLAFCFYALSPTLIAMQSEFFAENLALMLLLLCIWLRDTSKENKHVRNALAGLSCGLAVLTHPLFLFFPLCVFIADILKGFGIRKNGFQKEPVFFLILLITVSCWILPKSISEGKFVPVQQGSMFNFWLGNHIGGPYTPGICSVPPGDAWHAVHDAVQSDSEFLPLTVQSWIDALSQRHFADIAAYSLKLFYPIAACELTTWSDLSAIGLTWIHKFFYHTFWILLIPAIACIFLLLPSRTFRRRCEPILLIMAAFYLAQAALVSSGRYRIAMHPACAALAAYFLCAFPLIVRKGVTRKALLMILLSATLTIIGTAPRCRAILKDDRSEEVFAATCVAESALNLQDPQTALTVLLNMPDWKKTSVANRAAGTIASTLMDLHNYEKAKEFLLSANAGRSSPEHCHPSLLPCWGRYYAETGNPAMAEQCYIKSIDYLDATQRYMTIYNYGLLLQEQKRFSEAKKCYESALRDNPAFVRPWSNLGVIAMEEGHYSDAVKCFKIACQLDPHNPRRIVNYAAALLEDGQKKKAKTVLDQLISSGKIPDYAHDLVDALR